jgi:hypothetical protein
MEPGASGSDSGRPWGARAWVTVINAVLAGVAGVSLGTQSIIVTVIAAVVAVAVVALLATRR